LPPSRSERNREVVPDKGATKEVSDGVPNLIKVADKHDAKITFPVMPVVLECIPEGIESEISLHVHPGWEEFRRGNLTFQVGDIYLCEHCEQCLTFTVLMGYPHKEQLEMIKTGSDYLEAEFGKRVSIFVAGMWSLDNNTVKALQIPVWSGTARPLHIPPPF